MTQPRVRRFSVPSCMVFIFIALAVTGCRHPAAPADKAGPKAAPLEPVKIKTGAELYAIHCTRCHAERPPLEFTSGQWQTLMIHMRVRANLPARQAKEILEYLQAEAGR